MYKLVLTAVVLLGCQAGEVEILYSCSSPDGRFIATFVRESGGGAAGYQNYYVRILEASSKNSSEVFKMAHGHDVRLRWLSQSHLEIGHPSEAAIDHWQNRFGKDINNKTTLVSLWPGRSASKEAESGCDNSAS